MSQSAARKKTVLLNQALIDRARRVLGTRTETETISLALEVVVRRAAQVRGLRALAALGPLNAARAN